jgi:tetratricopeptide (TPR) repeat protein
VPPKPEASKPETSKPTASKPEPPKTTASKPEPPKPEAPRVDPAAAEAAFQRGEAELRKGQYAEAIAAYGEAIGLNPKHGPAYSRRGRADLLSKKYPEAIADYTRAIALDPKNPAFKYRGRAEAHWHSGNREAAAADFRQLIALCEEEWKRDRDDPDSANRLAWLLATLPVAQHRDGRRAVDLATKVCQLTDYESFESLETLAAACAETGDFTAAIKWSQQAIERAPDDRKAGLAKELESYRSAKPWRDPPETDAAADERR